MTEMAMQSSLSADWAVLFSQRPRLASIRPGCRLTCTMPRVAEVTGSEKSPPGGETAPTMVTLPSRLGLPRHDTLPARS